MTLAFVDCETTGLDHLRHEVWEVGLVVRDEWTGVDTSWTWFLRVDLGKADPQALAIGHYYERFPTDGFYSETTGLTHKKDFSRQFEELTRGATLVGANVRFDEAFLHKLLVENGACPGWHFRLCDVEAMAQGHLGLSKPLGLVSSAKNLGIDVDAFTAHEALEDAKLAREVYDRIIGKGRQ